MGQNFKFMKVNILNLNLMKFATFFINKNYLCYPYAGFPLKFQKKNLGKKNKNLGKFIKTKNRPLEGVRESLN